MAAWGYEFYLLVLKVFLTRERSSLVRILSAREDKIRIPKRPFNILYIFSKISKPCMQLTKHLRQSLHVKTWNGVYLLHI